MPWVAVVIECESTSIVNVVPSSPRSSEPCASRLAEPSSVSPFITLPRSTCPDACFDRFATLSATSTVWTEMSSIAHGIAADGAVDLELGLRATADRSRAGSP